MTLIGLQCFFIPAFASGPVRKRIFTENFMNYFVDLHKEELKHSQTQDEPIKSTSKGYPDHGSGVHSMKLSYRDWFDFNNAVRVHMNLIEQLPLIMVLLVLAGLKSPFVTLICAIVYFLLRIVFAVGYFKFAPSYRIYATLPMLLLKILLLVYSFQTVHAVCQYGSQK
ncbi:mapeg family protein [Stylonychia lemnae]|uniref:Mapeg family protein n=1 Tax=Stylonychia lemnae TaxID=5949 RepID=A0A078AAX9_STYLE|nr:mapeg family protein [Stylonychia lemnae]|eukprot:CDW78762.1 mapeg family protein [Stylonychia lemnae]